MRLLHGLRCRAYRGGLVDLYLSALSCLLVVAPSLFTTLVQAQQPLLLADVVALLKQPDRLHSRTLMLAADLLALLLVSKTLLRLARSVLENSGESAPSRF